LSFGSIAHQISELRGVKNRPFPLTRHIAYTTACCYRTSRDSLSVHVVNWSSTTSSVNSFKNNLGLDRFWSNQEVYYKSITLDVILPETEREIW